MKTPQLKTPKSVARCKGMLDASLDLFTKKGFHKTGLLDIIKKSGGSLGTLYTVYGSKEGILKVLIERKATKICEELEKSAKLYENCDLREFLVNIGKVYMRLAKNKQAIEIKKIVIQAGHNDQVASLFCELATKPIFKLLTDFFSKPNIAKQLSCDDYNLLAFRFFNLLEEPMRSWGKNYAILNNNKVLEQNDKWIENCVDFLLNGAVKK